MLVERAAGTFETNEEYSYLIRERAEIFNSLSPEEQERIRENFRRYQEMKRERRELLRERYNRLTPEQRRELHERIDRQRGGRRGR